ncbi:cell division protein ZapA [Prevotella sp. oral taxon 376]|uniref:cell division protein ZapA n=1 Tax=Prevotella sp. oral taxon 376 TaxID=712466 RepID=UPI000D1F887D|nr:cell division protein ZapA [Prevotella sp. oral taxon 376]PTL32758.1 cell division protein ZapA [Prevotella sp. oral taxon 376]
MSEANGERLHIRLHVYDTDMPVTVPREDEEFYRKCAKLITDIVNSYSAVFKGKKSDKEILYMALIDIALRYEKESMRHDAMPFNDILGKLTLEIEEALK